MLPSPEGEPEGEAKTAPVGSGKEVPEPELTIVVVVGSTGGVAAVVDVVATGPDVVVEPAPGEAIVVGVKAVPVVVGLGGRVVPVVLGSTVVAVVLREPDVVVALGSVWLVGALPLSFFERPAGGPAVMPATDSGVLSWAFCTLGV
jgi:hypothetical protein